MNAKLNNITTQYRKFNENQALTDGQLNEFIDYFEDQDRMSRTRLSGVGVACGFKPTFVDPSVELSGSEAVDNDATGAIVITQGVGVTTDGDLVTLRRKGGSASEVTINFSTENYRYYREYKDVAYYNHFKINGTQIPLVELLTKSEYDLANDKSNIKSVREIANLKNQVVILYLESYSIDEKACEDDNCNNIGAEQVSNLKVLLVDAKVVSELLAKVDAKDSLYKLHNGYQDLFDNLPAIEARRVILNPGIATAGNLKTVFQEAIGEVTSFCNGFNAIAETFNVSLDLRGDELVKKVKQVLKPTTSGLDDYQYRYDLLKDLIDTYNEIKSLLLHLNAECCPDIASFPKHLMLGTVNGSQEFGARTPYRHAFYHSPVSTRDDENYERIVMLANRFVQKVKAFQSYKGPVKITPSHLQVRLGDKAIPYYYDVDQSLLTKWNFEKTKTDREIYNLSYHTGNLAAADFIQNPLNYTIDDNDFYRIEGHLGLPFEMAVQNINDLKAKYGLAFDVAVLFLNKGERGSGDIPAETKEVSIDELRKELLSISKDISREKVDPTSTLLSISKLDSKLRLLNKVDFTSATGLPDDEITVVKEDVRKEKITGELLSDFLERKSGLEHLAGVEPGGTFVLICESEANNQVLADFSLPYLCCSKEKPNIPPIAMDDKASCLIGQTVVISVMDNDYDADNDMLTVVKKSDPSHGTLILNSNGTFTYKHDGSVNLEDSFTYCVNDGKDDSNTATVYIGVKSPPVALDDHATTESLGSVNIAVEDNDYDLGNTPLTVVLKDLPINGTATLNTDGTVKYIHKTVGTLTDSFTYYINDGELDSNIARVTISIAPPPCDSGMDVVFIFDYTGSMSTQIEAAKAGVSSIINTIKGQSGTKPYRLGIVLADEYGSGTQSNYHTAPAYTSLNPAQKLVNSNGSRFQWITAMQLMAENNESSFTSQLTKLNNPSGGLSLGYGYYGPEPTDLALKKVVENNFAGQFRDNVAKYVIVITDEVPGGDDDTANALDVTEMERLKNKCLEKSIKVIVLGDGVGMEINGRYIWKELAEGTGGSWNSGYNASAIQTAIINGCGGK